jgi:hypothetical protein
MQRMYRFMPSSHSHLRSSRRRAALPHHQVDATEQPDLAGMFEVKGYPTIKWFIDGEVASDYNGGRDA